MGIGLKKNTDLIRNEGRIEGVDYDVFNKIIYYADSYKKTIKRSLMPGFSGANIGYGQDLEIKSNGKPTALAFDWIGGNLYWAEQSRSGASHSLGHVPTRARARHARTRIHTSIPTCLHVFHCSSRAEIAVKYKLNSKCPRCF
jgi:hypothetical protein